MRIRCTICDSDDSEVFRTIENHDPHTLGILPNKAVSVCRSCGNIFQNPCLSHEELARIYCEHEDKVHVDSKSDGITQWENLKRIEVLRQVVKTLGRKGRLLEIGCSEGSFIFGALTEGFECHAVEPSRRNIARFQAHQHASQVCLWPYFFENCSMAEQFDFVTHYYVLEHSHSPRHFLEKARKLIQPGGMMLFEVPDVSRFPTLPFAIDLFPAQHISHFYPETITALLYETGWEPVAISKEVAKPTKSYGMSVLAKPITGPIKHLNHHAQSRKLLTEYFSALVGKRQAIQQRLEPTIRRWITSGKIIVIFGAGENGRFVLEQTALRDAGKVLFCDSDDALQGQTVLGIPVISPSELSRVDVAGVVIASLDYEEDMTRTVMSMGAPRQSILPLYEYSYRRTSSPTC